MPKILVRIYDYLGSRKFYILILALFVLEAGWIALSAAYPQAFDEGFHFGIIKVYSHYWLPFLSAQPPHADAYGAVFRDPSYLYHYLMSFPYRVIALFVHSQIAQIIILRFINIALFTYGIILFRKILRRVGTSKALSNLILSLFILIPIVPQLAGQINYDNLIMPLTAAMILLSFRVLDEVRSHQPSIWSIVMLIGFGLEVSLVKYAFLPIFAGIALFMLFLVYRTYKRQLGNFFKAILKSWQAQTYLTKIAMVVLIVVSFGMFYQRDIINLIDYHSIEPNCAKVLSVKQCMNYSVWAYNYKDHNKLASGVTSLNYLNPVIYLAQWVYWMWYRLFFAVNGPNDHFANYPPLPLPSLAALIVGLVGLYAVIKWWRKIFANNIYLVLLFVVTASYLLALIAQGYVTYNYTAVLENMNGRYLLPVLLLGAAIAGQAISVAFKDQARKIIFAVIILFLFIEGGGILTFISRSGPSWDLNNKAVVTLNNKARKVVNHVVVKGHKNYKGPIWFFN